MGKGIFKFHLSLLRLSLLAFTQNLESKIRPVVKSLRVLLNGFDHIIQPRAPSIGLVMPVEIPDTQLPAVGHSQIR
jgi:hypothetical protein